MKPLFGAEAQKAEAEEKTTKLHDKDNELVAKHTEASLNKEKDDKQHEQPAQHCARQCVNSMNCLMKCMDKAAAEKNEKKAAVSADLDDDSSDDDST